MIVVEGVDNAGKSTLASFLAQHFKLYLIKSHWRPETPSEVDLQNMAICTLGKNLRGKLVSDRLASISEFVYGSVVREESLLPQDEIMDNLMLFRDVQPTLIIHCRPPDLTILTRFRGRRQMEGVERNLTRLLFTYDKFMDDLGKVLPVIHYDWTEDQYFNKIRDLLKGSDYV